jgi:hypothetical protein
MMVLKHGCMCYSYGGIAVTTPRRHEHDLEMSGQLCDKTREVDVKSSHSVRWLSLHSLISHSLPIMADDLI